jgi:4-hydroxybenzoate polyprenyltransferase
MFNKKDLFGLLVPEYLLLIFSVVLFSFVYYFQLDVFLFIFVFILCSGYTLGLNVFNNLIDSDLDKIIKPNRPIPSGRISKRTAFVISLVFFLISIVCAYFINFQIVVLTLFCCFISILYSIKQTRLKDKFLGPSFVGGFLYGVFPFILVSSIFGFAPDYIFALFLFGLIFSIAPVKDIEDSEGEKKLGGKNFAILFGPQKTISFSIFIILLINFLFLIMALLNIIETKFIFSSLISCSILLFFYYSFCNKMVGSNSGVISQSKLMSKFMVLIVIIQLIYGVTNIYIF